VTNYDLKTFEKLYGALEIVNINILYFMNIIKFIVIELMCHRIPKLIKLIGNNVLIFDFDVKNVAKYDLMKSFFTFFLLTIHSV